MKLRPRHCLSAALLLSCLLVASGRTQWVEDSLDCGGAIANFAYNPLANVVYAAVTGSDSEGLVVISCDSNRIVARVPLRYMGRVSYDSLDNKCYAIAWSTSDSDTIVVIDGATHTRVGAIPVWWAARTLWNPITTDCTSPPTKTTRLWSSTAGETRY